MKSFVASPERCDEPTTSVRVAPPHLNSSCDVGPVPRAFRGARSYGILGIQFPARPRCSRGIIDPTLASGHPRSLVALPISRIGTALPRACGPSCESASSASSRGAIPAMALLRFSTPPRVSLVASVPGPAARLEPSFDLRTRPTACKQPGLADRYPRRPREWSPLSELSPRPDRCRLPGPLPSCGCPRSHSSGATGPLQGFDPRTECL